MVSEEDFDVVDIALLSDDSLDDVVGGATASPFACASANCC